MIRGSWCSKSRLAKAARAEVAVQQKNEKWHAAVAPSTFSSQNEQNTTFEIPMSNGTLWRKAHFPVKMHNKVSLTKFWNSDVKKWHAAVARSTCSSQNNKKLTGSGYFLKLRCRKMARGCGAKHICKAKCAKEPVFCHTFWSSDVEKLFS